MGGSMKGITIDLKKNIILTEGIRNHKTFE